MIEFDGIRLRLIAILRVGLVLHRFGTDLVSIWFQTRQIVTQRPTMLRKRSSAALVLALSLCACTSRPAMEFSEVKSLLPAVAADKARIYVYRDESWRGKQITPEIVVGGKSLGRSEEGEFVFIDTAPGTYEVHCGDTAESVLDVNVAAGQEIYVKTEVGPGIVTAHIIPHQVEPMVAIPEIRTLKYDLRNRGA